MTAEIEIEGHRLVAVCPDDLNAAAQSMLAKFAELHARGPALHPGSVIDFGWAPLRIEAMGDVWFVCEPDFAFCPRCGSSRAPAAAAEPKSAAWLEARAGPECWSWSLTSRLP